MAPQLLFSDQLRSTELLRCCRQQPWSRAAQLQPSEFGVTGAPAGFKGTLDPVPPPSSCSSRRNHFQLAVEVQGQREPRCVRDIIISGLALITLSSDSSVHII